MSAAVNLRVEFRPVRIGELLPLPEFYRRGPWADSGVGTIVHRTGNPVAIPRGLNKISEVPRCSIFIGYIPTYLSRSPGT